VNSSSSAFKECEGSFNPANKFCYDGVIYEKCDGMIYDPTTQFCKGGIALTVKYCDYGFPVTDDAKGCVAIEKVSECYTVGNSGILATTCGRTDLEYCDWGPKKANGDGGCYVAESQSHCSTNYGTLVDKCPSTSLESISGVFTDTRDNKIYKWIKIGTQTWMAENMNYDVPDNATDVCYDNAPANCTNYGRLYDWTTAGAACPVGWHLPSRSEWTTLTTYVGSNPGTKLKAVSVLWNLNTGTDSYGFSALPGGNFKGSGFNNVNKIGDWWGSTESTDTYAYNWEMNYNDELVREDYNVKTYLYSVRCVKD